MKFKEEFGLLIINGRWNPHVFQPEWVGRYLLPEEKLTVEIPINAPGSPRYSTDSLRLSAMDNKFMFEVIDKSDATFDKIQELSLKIADYLVHTPIEAFGINFAFVDDSESLKDFFNFADVDSLKGLGATINSSNYHHNLSVPKDKDYTLNLRIFNNPTECTIDFNFHFIIKNMLDFKEKIDNNGIVSLRNKAFSMLSDVYGLEVE